MKLVFVAAALLLACTHPDPMSAAPMSVPPPLHGLMPTLLDDAARRSGVPAPRLRVAALDAVVWPDAALGCPQPGLRYQQVLMPGYRVQIAAHDGAARLNYHVGARGVWLYCPPERVQPPLPPDADPRA